MKQNVIIELSTPELVERLTEEKLQLTKLRLNNAVTPLENPIRIKELRRTIARIKTEIRRREINDSLKK